MKLTILGSGSGLITKKRGAPGYWLQIGKTKMLLDAGEGTLDRMVKLGLKPEELDYVFISHKHCDHIADIRPLRQYLRLKSDYYSSSKKRNQKVIIYSSKDLTRRLRRIDQIITGRKSGTLEYSRYSTFRALPARKRFEGFAVVTRPLRHIAKKNNLAFKFITRDKIFTYTGDVCLTDELIRFCRGTDVLLIDAAFDWEAGRYHLSSAEAGQVAAQAGVKTVILTHFYPQGQKRKRRYNPKKEATKYFRGKIIIAEDGLSINI